MTPTVPRRKVVTIAAVGVGAAALVGLGTQQALTRSSIEAVAPEPGAAVSTATPLIGVTVDDYGKTRDLEITLDGVDVTGDAMVEGDTVMVRSGTLKDGPHRVEVSYRTSNLTARSVRRGWSFETDTSAPRVAVLAPPGDTLRNARRVAFRGKAEPGATVRLAWRGGSAETVANDAGRWAAAPRLDEGAQRVTVTALDRAGNTTARRRRVVVDTTPPALQVSPLPAKLVESAQLTVAGAIPGERATGLTYGVNFNGQKRVIEQGSDAQIADANGVVFQYASFEEPSALSLTGRRFTLDAGDLPQGRNRITVWTRDRAGNLAKKDYTVFVNSTESFGEAEMVRGAKGEDVRRLQQRLKANKLYRGAVSGTYDKKTERAVKAYQRRRKVRVTGRIDQATLNAMVGRIIVNLGQRKLRLVRDGRVVKTYPVAIGQAAYPTPVGTYRVIDKQVDPAWFPPDSPWAEGLGPIPPGPGNPLGTRWIGTSAPAIGIHGTYASSSIGTAASHGCIRMHITDVEELFEEVTLGSTVVFKSA
jgi:lipoprotein-anchoring transpeptidase ErfK/SrfK